MGSHDAEEAAQAVQRLNHRGDERSVSTVARKNRAHGRFETADQLLGFLTLLVGHGRCPPGAENTIRQPNPNRRRRASATQARAEHALTAALGAENARTRREEIGQRDDADGRATLSRQNGAGCAIRACRSHAG